MKPVPLFFVHCCILSGERKNKSVHGKKNYHGSGFVGGLRCCCDGSPRVQSRVLVLCLFLRGLQDLQEVTSSQQTIIISHSNQPIAAIYCLQMHQKVQKLSGSLQANATACISLPTPYRARHIHLSSSTKAMPIGYLWSSYNYYSAFH